MAYAASLTGCPARPYINRVVQATREGRCIRQFRARPPPLAGRVCPVRDANPSRQGRGTRSELGRIWPPPPLAGRGPNPPASLTGWRPSRGQLRRIRQFLLYERTYPPEGGERRSPKGIVSSYEKRGGRRTASSPHGSLRPREGRSESIREYVKKIASNQLMHKN